MNDCVNGEMRDELPGLVNGSLAPDDAARVQEHVRSCSECAAEVELLRTARAALRLAPTMNTAKIAASVQASTAQRLAARRVRDRVVRVAGLSLIVVLGAVGLWTGRERPTVAPVNAAGSPESVEQPERPPAQLALGNDVSVLENDQLLALMEEVAELEALPLEEPWSLAIEPLVPLEQGEM